MRILTVISILFLSVSCANTDKQQLTAEEIVQNAIVYSGGNQLDSAILNFDFRDKKYKMIQAKGNFSMQRIFKENGKQIHDFYSNQGFRRKVNETIISLPDSLANKYQQSVNSVFYFALLPYKLNDAAVNKEKMGIDSISNQTYHQIKVTFDQEGGGEDFEDVFFYWFNTKNFALDYLAYEYHTNEGGLRFRKAYNERFVNGVRFVDYLNFKPSNKKTGIGELSKKFKNDNLKLLSKIELKNIAVK